MRYLDVLCIDGIMGVGKTSQVMIFRNFLKSHEIPNKIISLKEVDDTNQTKNQLLSIENYFKQEPNGIVICDGSIATDIVDDIARNMHHNDLYDKHKDNLQLYEYLNNKFNFVNIVLTPENTDICESRLEKKAKMENKVKEELENKEHLMITAKGLQEFDSNMLTYNIKFNNINLDGTESIMQIHKQILDIIMKNNIQIKKKPSNEGLL